MSTFSDVNLFLGQGSQNTLVYDADAINQNILLIITTPVRSKWFRPRLGSNIPSYLFDPVDQITASSIQAEIKTLLERNGEFRVSIDSVTVIAVPDDQCYYVAIEYSSPYIDPNKVKFTFNLAK